MIAGFELLMNVWPIAHKSTIYLILSHLLLPSVRFVIKRNQLRNLKWSLGPVFWILFSEITTVWQKAFSRKCSNLPGIYDNQPKKCLLFNRIVLILEERPTANYIFRAHLNSTRFLETLTPFRIGSLMAFEIFPQAGKYKFNVFSSSCIWTIQSERV